MSTETDGSKDTLPRGFFEMEIISNAPNNVELNEGSGKRDG